MPSAYHRLHTLLHTMRCIGEREDALCEMLHELKNSSGVSDQQASELRSILEHLPSQDYLDDLRLMTDLLDQPRRKPDSDLKQLAKRVANRKGSVANTSASVKSRPMRSRESDRSFTKEPAEIKVHRA